MSFTLMAMKMMTHKCICNSFQLNNITNLASYDLGMKIINNLFIHNLYVSHTNIVHH
jgi:hypothetical protein